MTQNDNPAARDGRTVLDRLRIVPTAVIADAMEVLGMADAVLPASVSCLAGGKVVGRARTILKAPLPTNAAQPDIAPGKGGILYDLIDSCVADDVIVLAVGGALRSANFGGNMAERASLLGVAGVITDGAIRDLQDFQRLGLGVFAAGTSPRSSRGHFATLASDVPVVCGGVYVRPGDYIVGDEDGVVILAATHVEQVLTIATDLQVKDEAIRDALAKGVALADAVKRFPKS